MRKLINYIRSCFCMHDWELIDKVDMREAGSNSQFPIGKKWTYRCKKCGYFQVNKNY